MALNEPLITELVEKDLVDVTLTTVDIGLGNRRKLNDLDDVRASSPQDGQVLIYDASSETYTTESLETLANLIFNEVPTQIIGALYSVSNNYVAGTLQVFVNGLKIYATQITYDPNNAKFTLDFTPEGSDLIEVNYCKQ